MIKQKKSDLQEFEDQHELLLQARTLRTWNEYVQGKKYTNQVTSKCQFLYKFFYSWKGYHKEQKSERVNMKQSLEFRDRLLKQKVVYILYSFAQQRIIPRKHYLKSLKQKALCSLRIHKLPNELIWTQKLDISNPRLLVNNVMAKLEKLNSIMCRRPLLKTDNYLQIMQKCMHRWSVHVQTGRFEQTQKQMVYRALDFRWDKLSKRMLNYWRDALQFKLKQ